MNDILIETAKQECLRYDRALGIISTINTYYPFDVDMAVPLKLLEDAASSITSVLPSLPHVVSYAKLHRSVTEVLAAFSRGEKRPEQIGSGLLNAYVEIAIATHQIQDYCHFITPLWEKFTNRLDGVVFCWTLGWHNEMAEGSLRNNISEKYITANVRL